MKPDPIQLLARILGVRTAYRDAFGQWRVAQPEALRAVLQSLTGHPEPLQKPEDAIHEHIRNAWRCALSPVRVLWDDQAANLPIRLSDDEAKSAYEGLIELEAGESSRFAGNMTSLEIQATHESGGELYTEWRLPLPPDLPWGYHRLSIRWSGKEASVLLIRAPRRAAGFPDDPDPGRSGLFLPLYALRTRHDWGAGDFSDLSRFSDWAGENGFEAVGTLPLLPTFLEEPFDPSPYAPVSRQFWGEHFIDPRVAPEFGESKEAGAIVRSANFQAEVETLRQRDTVDYARLWALKRPVLEALSAGLRRDAEAWERRVSPWVRKKPEIMAYATFRAVQEKYRGRNWRLWPEAQRSGNLEGASLDPAVIDFYLYTQMLAHEQLGGRTDAAASAKAPLYLDLPLGSHPDGFDHWREQDSFAEGMAVGAPPDPLFTGGQDWGFAPMHPGRVRTRGYRYFIACLRHHLAASKILRLDHAMGFHRLFWIPAGMGAEHGVYVHYKAEEFYAILSLESRRHGVALVGEDLGTVPGQVRTAMDRHGISRTYAMQLELREETDDAMGEIPEQAAACINTHDLPPFAAFWTGEDIEQLAQLGFYEEADRVREHERRAALRQSLMAHLRQKGQLGRESDSPGEILMGCLRILRNSPAAMTLVTLEDLWEERRRQNLPGSTNEVPNWRHRSRFSLEDFDAVENVQRLIREIALRPGRPGS